MRKSLSYFYFFAVLAIAAAGILTTSITRAQEQSIQAVEKPSQATFETSYNSYLGLYDEYRVVFAAYLKSRNNYLTYGTLASQTEVIEQAKKFMQIRNEVLLSYVDLLFLRNVSPLYNEILFQEKAFLRENQARIPAIATVKDAQKLSEDIAEHYPILDELSRQVTGTILLSRVESVEQKVRDFETKFNDFTIQLEIQGHNTEALERGLIEARNKLLLAQQNLIEARLKITQLQGNAKQYNSVRFTLFSTNQYLKESTTFFEELLQEVKYGNY